MIICLKFDFCFYFLSILLCSSRLCCSICECCRLKRLINFKLFDFFNLFFIFLQDHIFVGLSIRLENCFHRMMLLFLISLRKFVYFSIYVAISIAILQNSQNKFINVDKCQNCYLLQFQIVYLRNALQHC